MRNARLGRKVLPRGAQSVDLDLTHEIPQVRARFFVRGVEHGGATRAGHQHAVGVVDAPGEVVVREGLARSGCEVVQ